jgi:hypothetical protein
MTGRPTSGEFALLAAQLAEVGRRVDAMDQGGTRRNTMLAAQLAGVTADVAGLRLELREHDQLHDAADRARIIGRRWVITAVIAVLAVVETPLLYLVTAGHV